MARRSVLSIDMRSAIAGCVASAFLLMAWQWLGNSFLTVRLLLSTPTLVVQYFGVHVRTLALSFGYTAMESVVGLWIAITVALVFSAFLLYFPSLAALSYPWLLLSQVIPFVCIAPVVILIFGPGWTGKVFLSTLMCFFPILTNLVAGIKSAPGSQLELMMMMKAPRSAIARYVLAPHCALAFFASLRIAAPFSVVGAIVAEFNGAEYGIGRDIFISAKRLEPELMMNGVIFGAILSFCIYLVVLAAERLLGDWYWEV